MTSVSSELIVLKLKHNSRSKIQLRSYFSDPTKLALNMSAVSKQTPQMWCRLQHICPRNSGSWDQLQGSMPSMCCFHPNKVLFCLNCVKYSLCNSEWNWCTCKLVWFLCLHDLTTRIYIINANPQVSYLILKYGQIQRYWAKLTISNDIYTIRRFAVSLFWIKSKRAGGYASDELQIKS